MLKGFIRASNMTQTSYFTFGWGCGYILLPEDHPFYKVDYDEIPITVHGGLTFGCIVSDRMQKNWKLKKEDIGKYCIGFDALHHGDNLENWSREKVLIETYRLRHKIEKYCQIMY